MKVKKLISKGLILGILLNYVSILSYANTDIPSRYQTLEGEFIDLGDTKSEDIAEIEIFGNTAQDPNNLEDIQSVGDLYVDEEGEPILDSQGREQYKIDIMLVDGYNLINLDSNSWIKRPENNVDCITKYSIPVKPNTIYTYRQNSVSWRGIDNTTKDGVKISNIFNAYGQDKVFTTPQNCYYINIYAGQTYGDFSQPLKREMLLYEGDKNLPFTKEQATQESKITILLPCQLMKVGDVYDRLYWDNTKCKYIVEKKIGFVQIANNSEFSKIQDNDTATVYGTSMINSAKQTSVNVSNYINSITPRGATNSKNKEGCMSSTLWRRLSFSVFKTRLTSDTVEGFKELIKDGIDVYYEFKTPQSIETNITAQIKLPTYPDKTYIYTETENGITPTLKITIDRIKQVSQETVDIAISSPTSNNLALARMFVNMLPESLYKDQLQEQLNELFSEDMVLEKKNATANLDVYIKSENILQISLDTNSITFEDFSGVEDITKENAVQISINSSLPYSLNAYLPIEIQNSDKSNTMNKDILNIKENSEIIYQTFDNTSDKIILKDNNPPGNNLSHGIDIKLKGNIAHEKDVYKTTIKFEAQQK